jgi:hypothetical protein
LAERRLVSNQSVSPEPASMYRARLLLAHLARLRLGLPCVLGTLGGVFRALIGPVLA